jgi:predicted phage terminase large subunit-like protein
VISREDLELIEQTYIAKSRKSFYAYRRYMNPKLKTGWFVKEISNALQQFYEDYKAGKRPKLVMAAPPQHGKSQAIMDFIHWLAGKNSELMFIFASYSDRLGMRANLSLRRASKKDKYKKIFPGFSFEGQINLNMIEFSGGGSFRNTTVEGAVSGESLDIGLIDDPLKGRKAANSKTTRDNVWNWFTDDFYTRFDETAGLIIILTRWHLDDPVGRLKEKIKDLRVISYKAIANEDEAHRKEGEPLFPEHKTLDFLMERKGLLAEHNWESLYQQNPMIPSGNLFNIGNFKPVSRQVFETLKIERRFITADTALKSKEVNDYTVFTAFAVADNKLYIIDMYRGKPQAVERETIANAFYAKHSKYPFRYFYIEQKASGIDLFQRMKAAGKMVKEVERNIDKIFRGENIKSYVETHNVYYLDDMPHTIEMIDEVQQFPSSTYDDIIDTIIDGVEITYTKTPFDYSEII